MPCSETKIFRQESPNLRVPYSYYCHGFIIYAIVGFIYYLNTLRTQRVQIILLFIRDGIGTNTSKITAPPAITNSASSSK